MAGMKRTGCLLHWYHTHGVGVTGAWTPAGKHNNNIASLEESSSLTYRIEGKKKKKKRIKSYHLTNLNYSLMIHCTTNKVIEETGNANDEKGFIPITF